MCSDLWEVKTSLNVDQTMEVQSGSSPLTLAVRVYKV